VIRSLADHYTVEEARDLVMERLQALGRAHDLLTRADWKGVSIREILKLELAVFGARVQLAGPDLVIDGSMVQTLSLMVHELITNAVKHGALSNETGTVDLSWSISGANPNARFSFRWEERNGPVVKPPTRKGFGTTLLTGVITFDSLSRPQLRFETHGMTYEVSAPLSAVQAA
jgi:two-component sensor histidine kinase